MGRQAVAPSPKAEAVWGQVTHYLRKEIGDGAFASYVEPACIRRGDNDDLFLVAHTAYARDWLLKNAMRRINELWIAYDHKGRQLKACARTEYDAREPRHDDRQVLGRQVSGGWPQSSMASTDSRRAVQAAGLQERLTFDTFVTGRGNSFAHETAVKIGTWGEIPFNPVFFCGPYGHGKTHLLNAIAWEAQRSRPEAKVIYLTAERFLRGFVRALNEKTINDFKENLRGADLLLLDDIHFVGGKKSTQEELFHTLLSLLEEGRRVVMSGDRPPSALSDIEPRLRSYLASGLTCPVESGDRSVKLEVLHKRLAAMTDIGLVSGEARSDVLEHLVDKTAGSIRELEGALNTVVAAAGGRIASLSVAEVKALLSAGYRVTERRITVDEIQKVTSEYYGLKQADLLSPRRTRQLARPRQVAMYLCKQLTTRSYPDIGRRFGGRDHTTVLHGVRKIESLLESEPQIASDVEALTQRLRG